MQVIHVLLLEDNTTDALLLEEALADQHWQASFRITLAKRLTEGLKQLTDQNFDVVLLDLGLPDSEGLQTFTEINNGHPRVPVVVLTGLMDKETALNAVSHGAQDYLIKGQVSSDSLARVIRYAIERNRLQSALMEAHQDEQRQRELNSLAGLAISPATSVTARTFGVKTIHETSREAFSELSAKYDAIFELAVEQRTYKVENRIPDRLRDLAIEIGVLRGGPRDVIELHTAVINAKLEKSSAARSQFYTEEGRLLVLELMGHLVTHYRTQARLDSRQ